MKANQSASARKRWANPEARELTRQQQLALWANPEHRARMLSNQGSGMSGKKHSEKTKAKMRDAQNARYAKEREAIASSS